MYWKKFSHQLKLEERVNVGKHLENHSRTVLGNLALFLECGPAATRPDGWARVQVWPIITPDGSWIESFPRNGKKGCSRRGDKWLDLIGAELLLIWVDSLWFGPRRALIILWKSEAWLLQCLIKLFIAHEWWNNFLPTLQQCSQRCCYWDPTGRQQFNRKEEDKEESEVFIRC